MIKANTLGMDTCSPIRLSVIVPVYNAAATLRPCVESILQYEGEDVEILLINDGSTDGSADICNEFARKDKRVNVCHKANGGVSTARNQGLDMAHGEWITFVDADDKATLPLLSYKPEKDCDLVCFSWEYTTGEKEDEQLKDETYCGNKVRDFFHYHLADFIFRCPWAKLFKRSIIESHHIRFDERFHLGEDNLFVLDYLCHCQTIITTSDIGYIYLRPNQSKYALSLDSVSEYLSAFMSRYHTLDVDCKPLLLLLEYYYSMRVDDSTFKARIKWEKIPAMRAIRRICWKEYGKKEKAKIVFRELLSLLVH